MDWKSIVRTVAPAIGTALFGPLGTVATTTLANVLLPADEIEKLKDSPEKLAAAVEKAVVGASPEMLAKIKQADNNFKEQMTELGIDLERIHANDRKDARKREAATKDKTPAILAILYLIALFGLVIALCVWGDSLKPAVAQLLNTVLVFLIACVTSVKDYYFGSSSSSAQKNVLLKQS